MNKWLVTMVCGISCMIQLCMVPSSNAARLKDIASIKGIRTNQLIGYGLVVGLNGTGDKSAPFTTQSLVSMMDRMGIHVNKNQVKVKNVAAVMVTSQMPPFARIGNRVDIIVSSVGDAKSLVGGMLLRTPLRGVDGKIYALAQGSIAVGGSSGGGKTHLLATVVTNGASIEKEISVSLDGKKEISMSLSNPDFTTIRRVVEAINQFKGLEVAKAIDSGTLKLKIPVENQQNVSMFLADIENLDVVPDTLAKIIVNEKTGTVIIGENVRISTVAVSHGDLSITIGASEVGFLPKALMDSETVISSGETEGEDEEDRVILFSKGSTIGELVRALNAIGASPGDLINIFQSIKASGALQAKLEII